MTRCFAKINQYINEGFVNPTDRTVSDLIRVNIKGVDYNVTSVLRYRDIDTEIAGAEAVFLNSVCLAIEHMYRKGVKDEFHFSATFKNGDVFYIDVSPAGDYKTIFKERHYEKCIRTIIAALGEYYAEICAHSFEANQFAFDFSFGDYIYRLILKIKDNAKISPEKIAQVIEDCAEDCYIDKGANLNFGENSYSCWCFAER